MSRARAAATSATDDDPVSTVMMSVMPSLAAASTAASDRPCPSSRRLGTYGRASMPRRRSARTRIARPVRPSASKSPKTMTRSPLVRTRSIRASRRSPSGRRRGSLSPATGGARNAASCSGVVTPRRARTADANTPKPCCRPASRSSGARRSRSGNRHRWRGVRMGTGRGSVIGSSMPRATRPPVFAGDRTDPRPVGGRGMRGSRSAQAVRRRAPRAGVARPLRRSSQCCQTTSSGAALKIEE